MALPPPSDFRDFGRFPPFGKIGQSDWLKTFMKEFSQFMCYCNFIVIIL